MAKLENNDRMEELRIFGRIGASMLITVEGGRIRIECWGSLF